MSEKTGVEVVENSVENSVEKPVEKSISNGIETGYKVGPGRPPLEHRFSSTNQPKKNGRHKEVKTILREFRHDVSDEVVQRIASVMLAAVACKSTKEAQAMLKKAEEKEPEYGWIYQETIRAIQKDGLRAILDVLEWIFGKKTILNVSGDLGVQVTPLVDLTQRGKNGQ
jgi:hypothetical protein